MHASSSSSIRQLTILGPGLLGGSIGLAVKKRKLAHRVVVWGRRIESAREAVKRGAADHAAVTPAEAVQDSDLIILCTPIGAMPELAREFRSKLKRHSIVTDVGSTKYDIVKKLSLILAGRTTYIGSHPMAGSEKDGFRAANANLFEGAVCILTPQPRIRTSAIHKLTGFWQKLGCYLRTTTPAEHDEIVAYISHLPHLTAAALMNLSGRHPKEILDFIGNGFRDMTRIAEGPAEMWSEIAISNREEIRRALDCMIDELETIRRYLTNASDIELCTYLQRAGQKRKELKNRFQERA